MPPVEIVLSSSSCSLVRLVSFKPKNPLVMALRTRSSGFLGRRRHIEVLADDDLPHRPDQARLHGSRHARHEHHKLSPYHFLEIQGQDHTAKQLLRLGPPYGGLALLLTRVAASMAFSSYAKLTVLRRYFSMREFPPRFRPRPFPSL